MMAPETLRDQHFDRLIDEIFSQKAEELFGLSVDEDDLAAVVDHDHGARGRFDDQAEALFGAFPLRDVDDGRKDEAPLLGLDRVQANLDGNLAAVFAQPEQVAPGAHRPRLRVAEKFRTEQRMLAAKTDRHEGFDRLIDELVTLVAE